MDIDASALSDADLEAELLTWAGRVAAGEAVVLRLLGEVDARGTWAQHGLRSCAHWVSWRLGLTLATAREKVRVARALRGLPVLRAAFEAGRLSYAQVRAVTRVATPRDEHTWVDLARHCNAAQLELATRGAGRVRRDQQREENPELVEHEERARVSWDSDGTLVLTLRIPPHEAPKVLAALEQGQAEEQAERDAALLALATEVAAGGGTAGASAEASSGGESSASAETFSGDGSSASAEASSAEASRAPQPTEPYVFEEPPLPDLPSQRGEPAAPDEAERMQQWWAELRRRRVLRDAHRAHEEHVAAEARKRHLPTTRASLADGLVRLLTGPSSGRPVKVELLVDPVSGWARTTRDELLPPSTMKGLLRILPGRPPGELVPLRPLTEADLRRHDQGRRSRVAPPALRRLLGQLDGERCRFPGCSHTRFLHAHHVRFWRDGGRTDLSNMVLVCSAHHAFVHDEGYRLALGRDRALEVRTAEGTRVLHHPGLPRGRAEELDPERVITPTTLPTAWSGERMDLGYVVNVMLMHAA